MKHENKYKKTIGKVKDFSFIAKKEG